MSEPKKKEVATVLVSYEEFIDYNFVHPGSFYVRMATGDFIFFKTSDRKVAQQEIDNMLGKGRYTAIPSKTQKTKSKLESGGLSCTGTASRRK